MPTRIPTQSPAFQFYADDFLAGTADMTAEEVGVYIRLLCHAWNKRGLDDNDRLSLLAGQCQASSLAHAKTKFRLTDGKLKNDRQEEERTKQSEYRTRQAENGRKRWAGNAKPDAKPDAKPSGLGQPPSPSPSSHTHTQADANLPTWEEIKTFAERSGIKPESAKSFYDHHEGNQLWINQHCRLINWQHKIVTWATNDRAKGNTSKSQPVGKMTKEQILAEAMR